MLKHQVGKVKNIHERQLNNVWGYSFVLLCFTKFKVNAKVKTDFPKNVNYLKIYL